MISSRVALGPAERDVFEDGAAEQNRVLQDIAYLFAQCFQFVVADTVPSMTTRA